MRYVNWTILVLALSACGKKTTAPITPAAPATVAPFAVDSMACADSVVDGMRETNCSTAVGVTQALPDACSTPLPSGGNGVPLETAGRTTGVYYTVNAVWDCGVRAGLRCVFVEYANGWQDMRCDDAELP